jgi:hypothetical protein
MAKQFRDIISADFVNKTFTTLKVTDVIVKFPRPIEIYYEGCTSPIILNCEEFNELCSDHIVEMHQGEVAIRFA